MIGNVLSRFVPSAIRRRLGAKFAVSILIVLLAIGAAGMMGYAQVDETLEQDTQETLESAAAQQSDAMNEWVQVREYEARMVSEYDGVTAEDPGTVEAAIEPRRASLDRSGIHVIDVEEEVVVASTTLENGASFDEFAYPWTETDFDEAFAGRSDVWVSDSSYQDPGGGQTHVVGFAADVSGTNRVVVLDGSLDLRSQRIDEGVQWTSFVTADGEPVLLADEDRPDDFDRDAIAGAAETGDGQFVRGDPVRAYQPVDRTDWVAVTSIPEAEAFAVQQTVGMNVLLIVGSALVALVFAGVVLGRQTVVPLKRLQTKATQMGDGDLSVDLTTSRTDEIGQFYTAFDDMRLSLREQIEETETAYADAERERERVAQLNTELQETANEYSTVMQSAADGDLTVRMESSTDNEAMVAIESEFNEMISEIESTIDRLSTFATEVATASAQVTASSEEVQSASEQVAEATQEISTGAEQQHESLQTANREIEQLSTTTQQIAASSNEVADVAERTADTGKRGQTAATNAIAGMEEIEVDVEDTVTEIRQLEDEVEQIDELIDQIKEIAKQTNMLALNANIEASRSAGNEDDGGFGAVAGEFKELSEDAKLAAQQVEARLEAIREQTERSASEVKETSAAVDDAGAQVEEAVDALEAIAEYARETNRGVQEISAATEQQAATTQEVVSIVDEAATISDETTSEAETVAAAAEEQTSAMSEVSESVSDLSSQATQLSEALDRFETDTTTEQAATVAFSSDRADADEADADPESKANEAETDSDSQPESDTDSESGPSDEDEDTAVDDPESPTGDDEASPNESDAAKTSDGPNPDDPDAAFEFGQ
ncbi:methyl-accepting chemotaxis protein [Natrarchaeobius chitinivorans]|uniref:HAMP domain-containing protein n=1 Tax=Natrarchaeobius chitinivorans TaxID=1679083 RepID=A0A3N6PC35_NATCH|nr:HAMP domain-containing methyl-accepting chemotaxis protein [Natrarchaeobius chitinivorans]RQG94235.1 HAMP domain-containing protein [Natrarchaeobius chitinivorans]